MNSPLRIVPLGGLGEVGMNCLALELDDAMVLIDCGVTFPDDEPGVDVIHPAFDYVLERRERLHAVVLTHGHEDHIGALPYLLREVDVPVFGPEYALCLVRERLSEFDFDAPPRLEVMRPREKRSIGPFEIESYQVTHSMPDSTGLVLRSRVGTLIHSGDFKIDEAPIDGKHFDLAFVEEVGKAGVRLLMSDSTNVDVEGVSGGEAGVAAALERHIREAKQRVIVSMFGSNVQRLAAVLRVARALDKQTLLLGRSLQTHARIAEQQGLLDRPLPTFISPELAGSVRRDQLLVIATGSQAEPRAALARLADGSHHHLRIEPEDTVILSSRIIPGRERNVYRLIDDLERKGVRVVQRYDDPALHVSGHACRDEQRKLLSLARPKTFVPVHGTFHHLRRHGMLAREMGVDDVFVLENGMVLEIDTDSARLAAPVQVGRVHVQAGNELPDVVLRDRRLMAEVGLVLIALHTDLDGALLETPRLLTRGVVWEDDERELLGALSEEIERNLQRLGVPVSDELLRDTACRTARRVFRDELGFRPLTHCMITRPTA